MGTVYGYALAQHNDVTLLDVRADVVDTIAREGIALDGLSARKVTATRDTSRGIACAFLFLFVKATDTLGALRPFAGQLDPATPIVSLQNGLGNEESIKAALGGKVPLALGITTEAAISIGHGRSQRGAAGTTVLGSAGASLATLQSIAGLLSEGGLAASIAYDIRPHLWGKLLVNAAINPVAALLDRKNAAITDDPDAGELARALALETAAVARASGVKLPFPDPWQYVREAVVATADARNSMTLDLEAHRRTEVDYINGAVVAAGRRAGVPTPFNEAMLSLVRARQHATFD